MVNVKVSTRDRRRAIPLSQSSRASGGSIGSTKPKNIRAPAKSPPSKYITENLSYPIDVDSDPMQGHYIMFFINTVIAAKLKGPLKGPINQEARRHGRTGSNIIRSLSATSPATKRLSSSISLYMPPSVQVSYGAGYTDHDIEVGAEALVAGGLAGAMAKGSMIDKIKEGLKASVGAVASEGLSGIVGKGISKMPGFKMGGLDALLQIGAGVAKSGRLEMLFNRMSRRVFSYTFTFVPKSQAESLIIQRIIFLFKSSMHPEYADLSNIPGGAAGKKFFTQNATTAAAKAAVPQGGERFSVPDASKFASGRNLLIPNTFDIEYHMLAGKNNYMNKISTCYLESLNVTYGGDKFRAYDVQEGIFGDGAPPQNITLALGFKEMEILTREAIHEGF